MMIEGGAASAEATTQTFTYTGGEQTFTVPAGVLSVHVLAIGAAGGNASPNPGGTPRGGAGGAAAKVSGELAVTPGELLYVEVGGRGGEGPANTRGFNLSPGGFNGGGSGGGGGGGASDVRTSPRAAGLSSPFDDPRLVVAGGGGGGGTGGEISSGGAGGPAGAGGSPSENPGGGAGTLEVKAAPGSSDAAVKEAASNIAPVEEGAAATTEAAEGRVPKCSDRGEEAAVPRWCRKAAVPRR
jgi:hypothetical protein